MLKNSYRLFKNAKKGNVSLEHVMGLLLTYRPNLGIYTYNKKLKENLNLETFSRGPGNSDSLKRFWINKRVFYSMCQVLLADLINYS